MTKYYICITPFFPSSDNWRGAFVLDQVKAINRLGQYKILVFTPCNWNKQEPTYVFENVTVFRFPSLFMPSYFFNGLTNKYNGYVFVATLNKLGINLKDIAVVHCHTASYACYCTAVKKKNPSVKTVIQYHDPDPYQVRNGKLATWKPNAKFRAKQLISQFKYIDLHLCISKKVKYNLLNFPTPHPKECFQSYLNILHVLKQVKTKKDITSYVLYNGVDTSQFYPIPNQKKSSIFRIGCIGNFADWKDHITLIRAIQYLRQHGNADGIIVSFIGSGGTRKECEEYIIKEKLSEYFIFEKEVHHKELNKYYNTLDLFVLPSFFEGFGCVFTEAAACGVPFMGCVNQGYSEYIPDEDRDKWLIEPGDYKRLAEIIESYMKFRYKQVLKEKYDIDYLIADYLKYLEKI